ncbi:hypothetical protein [Paraliomyxa miuraensis]|uniref:hypothetical protein n=1 Tax=Paraliomyxa miuraensis TaxID=376150 RepID=UPI0022538E7B|nr:hypothetical protein [Paraliomyxa miuraensis]MCX4241262.1 hypothetical protein [Paraliomyxa miuraensis]
MPSFHDFDAESEPHGDEADEACERPEASPFARSAGMSRRALARGMVGAVVTSGLFAGCRPCFSPFSPKHETKLNRGPRTFTLRIEIQPGRYRRLEAMLDDPSFNPFETPSSGIHFARLFTAEHRYLYFMVIYDDYEDAITFLNVNAKGVDPVFENCTDYPGASNPELLDEYVRSKFLCVELFYRAYDESQREIRDALALRDAFLVFVRSIEGVSDKELRTRYAEFLVNPNMLNHDRIRDNDVDWADTEAGRPLRLRPLAMPDPEQAISAPDRVSPFTLMARVHPSKLPKLVRTLRLGTFANIELAARPLRNLPTLHFARVSVVDGNQMLFASVYDGDFIQYVEDFSTRISKEIDTVFGASVGYPIAGSADIFAFKDFLRANQIVTRDFAGSYLDRSLLQIQSSVKLTKALARFSKRVGPDHRNLHTRMQCFLHDHQHLLT